MSPRATIQRVRAMLPTLTDVATDPPPAQHLIPATWVGIFLVAVGVAALAWRWTVADRAHAPIPALELSIAVGFVLLGAWFVDPPRTRGAIDVASAAFPQLGAVVHALPGGDVAVEPPTGAAAVVDRTPLAPPVVVPPIGPPIEARADDTPAAARRVRQRKPRALPASAPPERVAPPLTPAEPRSTTGVRAVTPDD